MRKGGEHPGGPHRAARDPDWDFHCAEFVIEHIAATTGRDIWAEIGGCPRSWREAADTYRRMGVRTLTDAVTKVLGEPIARRAAKRGDVAMVDGALGIVRGEKVEFIDRFQPLERVARAWRADGKR